MGGYRLNTITSAPTQANSLLGFHALANIQTFLGGFATIRPSNQFYQRQVEFRKTIAHPAKIIQQLYCWMKTHGSATAVITLFIQCLSYDQ